MSLGPIEFDNTKATFTNDVTVTDNLTAGGNLTVQGASTNLEGTLTVEGTGESHIHGRLVCDRTGYVSLSTAGEIRCEDDILVLKQGDSQGGRVIIYDGGATANHTMFIGGNFSSGQNPGIVQYGPNPRPFNLLAGSGQVRTNELSANDLYFRESIAKSSSGNFSNLSLDTTTLQVVTSESSSSAVLPGMIMPYYGHLATEADPTVKVDHAVAVAAPTTQFYPYNENTGTADLTWGYCNGQTYGSFTAPDLRGRTTIGAGTATIDSSIDGGAMTTRAMSATGGVDTLSLSPSRIPDHSHRFIDEIANTTHGFAPGGTNGFIPNRISATKYTGSTDLYGPGTPDNNSGGGIYEFKSSTRTRVTNAGANGSAFEMSSPYYVLHYLIKLPDAG